MGRPRRIITPEGYLRCAHCNKAKHINQFYQLNSPTWWIDPKTGTEYSRPHSWCSDCLKNRRNSDSAETRRNDEIERIRQEAAQGLGPPKGKETAVTGRWDPDEWEGDQN
jgi:hypothetical protein